MRSRLESYDRLYSANLLEAELRAAFARERVAWQQDLVRAIGWVLPARRLTGEIAQVLEAGYLRGADLWHVSCALHLYTAIGELDFLTLDDSQREVAAAAGLGTPL
ncbi:MAG: hypothetical protein KFH98_15435 [Gemmatimonadetes bacterium]|nr:hypothetical protein [Gemmatimonadota bacterium]